MKRVALLAFAVCASIANAQTTTSSTATRTARPAPTQVDSGDRAAAQYWGLTVEDYRRYQALMKGVRGAISDPRITPIEVLGIHARDDAERRKYAEMFAMLMAEDTERVLQFQLEYDRAFRRLHPKLVALDFGPEMRRQGVRNGALAAPSATDLASPVPIGMSRPPSAAQGDRVLVFTRDECRECDEVVRRALSLPHQGVTLDIYLVGARSAGDVQRHARHLSLDPALVAAGKVTLNLDGGAFARALPKQPELPAVVRKRGESLVQLATSEL